MNKKLLLESSLATILVFFVLWILFLSIHISFKPFNYVVKSIKAFNLNDLYFSKLENNTADTNTVIINIEDIDRAAIAEVLLKVNEANPKVIGLDVFFSKEINSEDDSILISTIHQLKDKLVMVAKYDHKGEIDTDFWNLNGISYGHSGILTNNNKTDLVREFEPSIEVGSEIVNSFSAEIASRFNSASFEQLKHRKHKKETIYYTGGANAYRTVNYFDLFGYAGNELASLKDKIVLVGYCGGYSQNPINQEDFYYTPVGFEIASNRPPDMYGIQIHANMISMIINGKYINQTPHWLVYLLTLLLTFAHVLFFTYFYVKKHLYYHIAAKLIQLVSFVFILWIVFIFFSKFHVYIPTKYLLVSVILSVDVLYFYEAIAVLLYKKFKIKSIFVHEH